MELRDYQVKISNKAASILSDFKLVYLALQTRTGKTITAMEIVRKGGFKNVLFVTKKKAISSIEKDYSFFSDYFNMTVINFESVHKCTDNYDLIIVDEAHSIGAFPKPSKRAKVLKEICVNKPIIFLSATPTPESFSQLFHQFYISSFSPWKNYKSFYRWAKDYVKVRKKYVYNREINDYSDAKINLIEQNVDHLFLRFTQEEAGFKNIIKEKFLTVEMSETQKKAINIILKDGIIETQDGNVIIADTAVKKQSKVHQISSGTCKNDAGGYHIISLNKANAIKEYFKGRKIAIYYKFKAELEALKQVFDNYTEIPEMFQETKDLVFFGQFVSGREGVRLDTAEAIVFYNIDFSFLSYEQAKNRIISKERESEAVLYWVFSECGIEEKIYKAVCNKKNYTNYYFKRDYYGK